MALIKLNNRAVKDVTEFGSITSLGSLTHISTATASASASIEFSLGDLKEYVFYFVNLHPQNDTVKFTFQCSTDGGSNYNTTITSTSFGAYHRENDTETGFGYDTNDDQAQGTAFQPLTNTCGNGNDESSSGYLHLFNPSSTTFVKHWISRFNIYHNEDLTLERDNAGYFNDINDLTNIKFQFASGNIDAGQILLFGVN